MKQRVAPWLIVSVCLIAYGIAFALPAAILGTTVAGKPAEPTLPYSGIRAYNAALWVRATVWLANPLFWIALALVLARAWLLGIAFSFAAVGVAATSVVREVTENTGTIHLAGYWLWTASMFAVVPLALWARQRSTPEERSSPRDLFRSWRKYISGSVIVLAIVFYLVFWIRAFDEPTSVKPEDVKYGWWTLQANGVIFELERSNLDSYSIMDGRILTAKGPDVDLRYWPEGWVGHPHFTVNDVAFRLPKTGDTVSVDRYGFVSINDQLIGRPTALNRITTPPIVQLARGLTPDQLAWHPTTRHLAVISTTPRGRIDVWDVDQQKSLWSASRNSLQGLSWSPNGEEIATIADRKEIVILDSVTGTPRRTIALELGNLSRAVYYLSNDWILVDQMVRYIASPLKHGTKAVTIVADRKQSRDHKAHEQTVAVHGNTIAYSDAQAIHVVTFAATPDNLQILKVKRAMSPYGAVAFSRDGLRLARFRPTDNGVFGIMSLDSTGTITGQAGNMKTSTSAGVSAIAYLPDHRGILLVSNDLRTVRSFWPELGEREGSWLAADPVGLNNFASTLAISADGQNVAVGFRVGKGESPGIRIYETSVFRKQ